MRLRAGVSVVISMCVVVLLLPGSAGAKLPVPLPQQAHISGRVVDQATSAGVAGMCVHAWLPPADRYSERTLVASATTDATGHYQLDFTMDKNTVQYYSVDADATCGADGHWQPAGYPAPIRLDGTPSGSTRTGVRIVTSLAGRIVGTITDDKTGAPISGAIVTADPMQAPWTPLQGTTSADGSYVLGGLASGSYLVEIYSPGFGADDLNEFVHHLPTSAGATQFAVTAGSDTALDETLLPTDNVSGTVTDSTTGLPAGGVLVEVTSLSGDWETSWEATTAADGTYTVGHLGPGTYSVCFRDEQSPALYGSACWQDQPYSYLGGEPLTVNGFGNTVSGVDQAVALAAAP